MLRSILGSLLGSFQSSNNQTIGPEMPSVSSVTPQKALLETPVEAKSAVCRSNIKLSKGPKARRRPTRDVVMPFQLVQGSGLQPDANLPGTATVHSVGGTSYICVAESQSPLKRPRTSEKVVSHQGIEAPLDDMECFPALKESDPAMVVGIPELIPAGEEPLHEPMLPPSDDNNMDLSSDDLLSLRIDCSFVPAQTADEIDHDASSNESGLVDVTLPALARPPEEVSDLVVPVRFPFEVASETVEGPENCAINMAAEPEIIPSNLLVITLKPEDYPGDLQEIDILRGDIDEILDWRRVSSAPDTADTGVAHFLVRMCTPNTHVIVPVDFFRWNERHKKKLADFLKNCV